MKMKYKNNKQNNHQWPPENYIDTGYEWKIFNKLMANYIINCP